MSIRKKLRERAGAQLAGMVLELNQRASEICKNGPIEVQELCRLAADDKKTVRAKAITKLANATEERLMQTLED